MICLKTGTSLWCPLRVPGKSAPSSWSEHHSRTPHSPMFVNQVSGRDIILYSWQFACTFPYRSGWEVNLTMLILGSYWFDSDQRWPTSGNGDSSPSYWFEHYFQPHGGSVARHFDSSIMQIQPRIYRDWCQCQMWSGNSAPSLLIRSLALMLIHPYQPTMDQLFPSPTWINSHPYCGNETRKIQSITDHCF